MKKTETFIVLRDKETGKYIESYRNNNNAFTFSTNFTPILQDATTNDIKSLEIENNNLEALAEVFGCEILIVEAEYTLKTLDGKELEDLTEDIESAKRKYIEGLLKGLLNDDEED